MYALRFASLMFVLSSSVALAEQAPAPDKTRTKMPPATIMTTVPADGVTVTHWYKKNVYDQSNSKVGEIDDILANRQGQITAFILGVGGFLGIGEKHVAVPFNAIQFTTRNDDRWYLMMNINADALRAAPGLTYDRSKTMWVATRDSSAEPKKKSEPKPNPKSDPPPK